MLYEETENSYDSVITSLPYRNKFYNVLNIGRNILGHHTQYFQGIYEDSTTYSSYEMRHAKSDLEHILNIITIEKTLPKKQNNKLFESSLDKYKQAVLFFEEKDYVSMFNMLNSSLELLLKEKLPIPKTTKIRTSNIIEKLVKHKIEPYMYLNVAKDKIIDIDNKVKHQGYKPKYAIEALSIMEELLEYCNKNDIILPENVREEIYEML
jgi:HEPN domain-containing protein